jgi:hypothetical protein
MERYCEVKYARSQLQNQIGLSMLKIEYIDYSQKLMRIVVYKGRLTGLAKYELSTSAPEWVNVEKTHFVNAKTANYA